MWLAVELCLVLQRHALMDAKAMLFIDDRQSQAMEYHLFLKQCMGTDDHRSFAAGAGKLS